MQVTKEEMTEYYKSVFPIQRIVAWLSYGNPGYFLRREWCFTLIGDIFTRFRSYYGVNDLTEALCRDAPEKIDVGAVYNVRTTLKGSTTLVPLERELIFDIDMSDYDAVRSCCEGKKVCNSCWQWMVAAGRVIESVLRNDFGFSAFLPVFSGRRGLHVWVCDKRARLLTDEDRSSLTAYMTVFDKSGELLISSDVFNDRLHPTLESIDKGVLVPAFNRIFLDPTSPNYLNSPKAFQIVMRALEKLLPRNSPSIDIPSFTSNMDWDAFVQVLAKKLVRPPGSRAKRPLHECLLSCLRFQLIFPRLDVDVSTKRNHLLKLPFCVHPATRKLCVPIPFEALEGFDPEKDPPTLNELLASHRIPDVWVNPLVQLIETCSEPVVE